MIEAIEKQGIQPLSQHGTSALTRQQDSMPTSTQQAQEELKEHQDQNDVEKLKKDLMQLTEQLNKEFNPLNMNVKFGFSDDIESLYVTVSERNTDRLIRKIPSDEAMELMVKMREIVGIIFDKKG